MKVLIVDDDVARSAGLAGYLVDKLGLVRSCISLAHSVDDAKKVLRSEYFDALVMDVVLPKRAAETADAANGFALLSQVSRGNFLRKPEKIIGITANEAEIATYRRTFDDYCAVVIPAGAGSDRWRNSIKNAIEYANASRASRNSSKSPVVVFTVHGIRTFGEWQNRLERMVRAEVDDVEFHSYKYGYFSSIAFLVPFWRSVEVRRLKERVAPLLGGLAGKRVVVFSHSFGTYLATQAIRSLAHGIEDVELCLVCAGSVLPENFDWSFARPVAGLKVVNDCGCDDRILLLSKCFALGLGMAGRTGFNGFNDERFHNRWFAGGHSHYFDGEDFMSRYWVPLIADSRASTVVDHRSAPSTVGSLENSVASAISAIKPVAYLLIALAGIVLMGSALALV